MVAIVALSSAVFAGTKTEATKEKSTVKVFTYKYLLTNTYAKATEQIKVSKNGFAICDYTLNVYNNSTGALVGTLHQTYNTANGGTCEWFFNSCRKRYATLLNTSIYNNGDWVM